MKLKLTKRYKQKEEPLPGKKKRVRIDRSLYLRMLRDTQKYPLLIRVASELYRNGFTPARFFRELHKDDYTVSNRIAEELERIDRGRNGYDPEKVPPVLPVLLEYRTLAELREDKHGRPTSEEARKVVDKWISSRLKLGWRESDLINALRPFVDPPDDDDVIKVSAVIDDEPKVKSKKGKLITKVETVTKVVRRKVYQVFDGAIWHEFIAPLKAKEFQEEVAATVVATIKKAIPVERIKSSTCECCGRPLNGQILTIRDEKGKNQSHLHPNCWWLHRAEPCRIPVGMTLLHPAEGVAYTWQGAEKGGWIKTPHESVPAKPSGDTAQETKPPETVADKPLETGFVRKV